MKNVMLERVEIFDEVTFELMQECQTPEEYVNWIIWDKVLIEKGLLYLPYDMQKKVLEKLREVSFTEN